MFSFTYLEYDMSDDFAVPREGIFCSHHIDMILYPLISLPKYFQREPLSARERQGESQREPQGEPVRARVS